MPQEFFGNAANMGRNSFTVERRTSSDAGTAGSNTRVCSTCFTATYLWRKVPAKPRDCKLGNDSATKGKARNCHNTTELPETSSSS